MYTLPVPEQSTKALAAAVDAQRVSLGLSIQLFAKRAGVSYMTARRIINGEQVRSLSLRHVDSALAWPEGTTTGILEGKTPPAAELLRLRGDSKAASVKDVMADVSGHLSKLAASLDELAALLGTSV